MTIYLRPIASAWNTAANLVQGRLEEVEAFHGDNQPRLVICQAQQLFAIQNKLSCLFPVL